jgi:hypothetical protein
MPDNELRCECDVDSTKNPNPPSWYLPEERKAMKHKPGKCPGTYELKQYRRKGKVVNLCSACNLTSDKEIAR